MKYLLPFLTAFLLVVPGAAAQEALRLAGPAVTREAAPAAPVAHGARDSLVAYEDGQIAVVVLDGEERAEAYRLGPGSRQANRFVTPPGARLLSLHVAPFYENDFATSPLPPDTLRDFRLVLWAGDGAGRPGAELLALAFEDARANAGGAFVFAELDTLRTFDLALPDTFYAGLENTGDDANHLVMGVAAFDGSTPVSYLYRPAFNDSLGAWRRFDAVFSSESGEPLGDRVLPIRAVFELPAPVADEEAAEVPSAITLAPNYPNPFNPTTTIEFARPRTADVRLAVYDLLGREVAVLVDGLRGPGTHRVEVDAARWSSGLYLYRLEAGGQSQAR
ncbi:MAG: T9SS type A sorting domain-containing protein, partial [Rhodothermales bacterium]|nr:T9SS type A sorting domain-containing protein [Rhodothermales bacterium]